MKEGLGLSPGVPQCSEVVETRGKASEVEKSQERAGSIFEDFSICESTCACTHEGSLIFFKNMQCGDSVICNYGQ